MRNKLAIAFAMVIPTIVTLVYFVWLKDHPATAKQLAYSVGKTIQFVFPVVWVWIFDRTFFGWAGTRSPDKDLESLPNRGNENRLSLRNCYAIGIGFGLLAAIAMPVIYYLWLADSQIAARLLEQVKEKTFGNGIDTPLKFLGLGIFYTICHSFMEEYYWRWFVFRQLKKFVSTWTANIVSSIGFMAHHVILLATFFGWNSPLTWIFSGGVCIGGIFWAWLYDRSGSLKPAWISHLLVDAGIFTLGYLMIRQMFAP